MIGNFKYQQINDYLRRWISEQTFADSLKLPSENMLCRKFDVSRHTVRRAMEDLEKEGFISRLRGSGTYVNKEAVLNKGFKQKAVGSKVAVVLQGQDRNANSELLKGLRQEFLEKGIDVQVFFTDNRFVNERSCIEYILSQKFSGIVIDGVKASILNPNLDCYEEIEKRGIPVVFYNNYYQGMQFSKIILNDHLAAEQLMHLLLDNGHRNIAGVFVYDNYQSIEKYKGYVRALRSYGASFNDDYIKWSMSGEAHDPHFLKTMIRFIRSLPECTAIVCCNYMLLQQVMTSLKTLERRVPEDCSVVCFDYSGVDWEEQDITCSVHPGYEIGVQSAREMLRRLMDKMHSGSTYIIDPHIHVGSSIATVNNPEMV